MCYTKRYRLLINLLSKYLETLGLVTYYRRESSPLSEQKVSETSRGSGYHGDGMLFDLLSVHLHICFISLVHSTMLTRPIIFQLTVVNTHFFEENNLFKV